MSDRDPKSWFQTYTGVQFWPLDPKPEDVRIEDIARGLAYQCRFNGHVSAFYSIAQHSVAVSEVVSPEHALWGLLHDAAEAYVGDLVRPIKLSLPAYRAVEAGVMKAICERFGLPEEEPPEVKAADNDLLVTERRDLLCRPLAPWATSGTPLPDVIEPWGPGEAELAFLARFYGLFEAGR